MPSQCTEAERIPFPLHDRLMSLKEFAKQKLSRSTLRKLRRYGRIRWIAKLQILRTFRFNIWGNPRVAVRYVLTDPEVESFTYDIENTDELVAFVAKLLDEPVEQVAALIREAVNDPVLGRDRGWSWSVKRHTPLGTRLVWYVIARVVKPAVAVETGIHQDSVRGSLAGASAQRGGRLSRPVDFVRCLMRTRACWSAMPCARSDANHRIDLTALEPSCAALVGLLCRDTPPTEECAGLELRTALRTRPQLVVIDSAAELVPSCGIFARNAASSTQVQ